MLIPVYQLVYINILKKILKNGVWFTECISIKVRLFQVIFVCTFLKIK